MIVPGSINPLLMSGQRYQIPRALTFNKALSQHLSRTAGSPTDSTRFSFSWWQKQASIGYRRAVMGANDDSSIEFYNNNVFRYAHNGNALDAGVNAQTKTSGYDHFLFVKNGANGSLYKNGSLIESLTGLGTVSNINTAGLPVYIGSWGSAYFFDGKLAEPIFVDGQTLSPSAFGENLSSVWWPKKYAGTYGNNGFWLDFSDPTNITTLGLDRSGRGNHFTLTNLTVAASSTITPTSA